MNDGLERFTGTMYNLRIRVSANASESSGNATAATAAVTFGFRTFHGGRLDGAAECRRRMAGVSVEGKDAFVIDVSFSKLGKGFSL
jgi:hypothetical protein